MDHVGILEKKMEATVMGLYMVSGLWFKGLGVHGFEV